MLDDYRSDDGVRLDGRQQGARRADENRFADREVPLVPPGERVFATAVHAWLDGELPEAVVRKGDTARDVDFWKRLMDAAETRRQLHTPLSLESRIMAALPQTVPQMITPWYRREFVVTPGNAILAIAGLVAATAAATFALLRILG